MKYTQRVKPMLTAAVLSAAALAAAGDRAETQPLREARERPNLLILMCDDLRIGMLGAEGHPFMETPNLDRFVTEGIHFPNAYALSPVCGPSRASIFTGQYSSHHMRRDNLYYPETYEYYLPQYFRNSGYKTALIGKYYEGGPFGPTARKAYDRWFSWMANVEPMPPRSDKEAMKEWEADIYIDDLYDIDGTKKQIMGHQTDILFDEAARFATEHKESPFCMFLSPFAPHMPFNMTERNKGKYAGRTVPQRPNLEPDEGYWANPNFHDRLHEWYGQYCEMIADIDDGMGRLWQALEENGQLDNTFIILISDNGYMFAEHGFAWKRHPWQESATVPFYVRYPKLANPGTKNDALVCLADVFFTCAEVGGVDLPEIPGQAGRSIVPILSGEKEQVRDELLLIQYEQLFKLNDHLPQTMLWAGLVRTDGWKLARYNVPPDQRPEIASDLMFRLSRDEFEMKNLAGNPEHGTVFSEMKAQLQSALNRNDAVLFSEFSIDGNE